MTPLCPKNQILSLMTPSPLLISLHSYEVECQNIFKTDYRNAYYNILQRVIAFLVYTLFNDT